MHTYTENVRIYETNARHENTSHKIHNGCGCWKKTTALNAFRRLNHGQALLRGALCQQSAVILICMAVDRYMCALHPEKYHQHSSKKVSSNMPLQNIYFVLYFLLLFPSSTLSISFSPCPPFSHFCALDVCGGVCVFFALPNVYIPVFILCK